MDHSTPKEDPFANQACTNIYLSTYPYILTTLQFRILLDVMSHIHRERHSVRKHVWPGHGQTQAFTTHRVPELVAVERLQLSIEGGPRGLRLLNGLQKRLDFARRLHLASSWQYSSAFFFPPLICSGCTERERVCVYVCIYSRDICRAAATLQPHLECFKGSQTMNGPADQTRTQAKETKQINKEEVPVATRSNKKKGKEKKKYAYVDN